MTRPRAFPLATLLCSAAVAFSGCGVEEGGPKDTDVGIEDDTSTGGVNPGSKWSIALVESDNVGLQADLDVNADGEVGVAYFSNGSFSDGECSELDHDPYPTKLRYDLKLATRPVDGSWSIENVDTPIHPNQPGGLSFKFSPEGAPAIAYTGGEPELDYCGANDAFLAVKSNGTWNYETAAADSADAAVGDEASDAGFGVGWYPALTFDPEGEPAIVYQDQHFVYLQRDDQFRADAELAWRTGGGWLNEAVDFGEGAGVVNEIMFDAAGRPIVFTAIPIESHGVSRHGVWALRRNEDGTWDKIQIHSGAIGYGISAALDPVFEEPVVAFYSAPDYGVKVRRLLDDDAFTDAASWTSEIVKDTRYDEGDYVSLAFSPDGELALSYHRCRIYNPDEAGCNQSIEAVVFALYKQGKWTFNEVKNGDDKSCGTFTSLAFSPDGIAHIAFQCTETFMGDHALALYVASKQI